MKINTPDPETGERGVILFTSSILSKFGRDLEIVYAGTKEALNALTLPLARDLGPFGIRVNAIAPGAFDTPINGELST
jgi:NAD(P)-dependent dehydrogenase (short-subunit alcohol dehydrogenase family)